MKRRVEKVNKNETIWTDDAISVDDSPKGVDPLLYKIDRDFKEDMQVNNEPVSTTGEDELLNDDLSTTTGNNEPEPVNIDEIVVDTGEFNDELLLTACLDRLHLALNSLSEKDFTKWLSNLSDGQTNLLIKSILHYKNPSKYENIAITLVNQGKNIDPKLVLEIFDTEGLKNLSKLICNSDRSEDGDR